MDSSESIGVYGEAKAEYTRQLCNFLVPALESYFLDLLKDTKETEKDPKRILWVFQDALKQFPDWNMDKVQRETAKISEHTKCDYLEEILTAVFIAHTKVLSAIRLTSKQKKLQITIPKLEHFLHRTMSECARLLWSNAYLFNDNISSIERQKNLRQVEQLLNEGVLQSIRGMLPVKSILKEYLSDEGVDMGASAAVEEAEEEVTAEATVEPVVKEEADIKEEAPVLETPAPPPSPAVLPSLIVDLSGVSVKEGMKEEVKEEVKEELKEEVKEESKPPMIHVDTEPVVSFTDMDTIFHHNPIKNMIGPSDQKDEEATYVDGIEIDESAPPEEVDDFDVLDKEDELTFAEDEFETL
jgi:SHS2 domain-containing protein